MKSNRDALLEVWVKLAKIVGFGFCDIHSPGKKNVKAILFAITERDADNFIKTYSTEKKK